MYNRLLMSIMGEVFDMKLSDFCIVFAVIVITYSLEWGMQNRLLQKAAYTKYCYNQLFDNAIEDGLEAGIEADASPFPAVDENVAVDKFHESLFKAFDVTETSSEGKRLLSVIGCIVILQNQYFSTITEEKIVHHPYRMSYNGWNIDAYMDGTFCWESEVTGERYIGKETEIREFFDLPEEDTEAVSSIWKNQIVTDCVEQEVQEILNNKYSGIAQYEIDFPSIEEEACHTLQGVGMLCFVQYTRHSIDGYAVNRFTVSGAETIYQE